MSIYISHLSSIPFKSELYLSRYVKFIEACLEANKSLPPDVYTEEHHILPKADSMFPQFTNLRQHPWNAARLTARQHFIAHLLLWKAYDNDAMTHAAQMMTNFHGARISSRRYEKLRKAHAAALSALLKGKPRKPFSDETKRNMSIAATGKPKSDETKRKMSIAKQGQKHYRFKGFYQTPFGTFESATAASESISGSISVPTINAWCKRDNLKVISNKAYGKSSFLRDNYARGDVVDKTFNDLGFSFHQNLN